MSSSKNRLLFITVLIFFFIQCPFLSGQIEPGKIISNKSSAAEANDYYQSAYKLWGTNLRAALHNIIKGHTVISYDGLYNAFPKTDAKPNNVVWDIYSDVPNGTPAYTYTHGLLRCGNYSGEGDCYNREHSWCDSWLGQTNPARSDLFHMYPTDGYVNNRRSNYNFGTVGTPTWTSTNGSKLGPNTFPGYTGTVFEPINEYKGDLARSAMYMSCRYYTEDNAWSTSPGTNKSDLLPWYANLFYEWHLTDTVSIKEINRNNVIDTLFQHNRNPFIDHPEFAAEIWKTDMAPAVVSVMQPSNTVIIIDFSRYLDSAAAVTKQNFVVNNSIGNPVSVAWGVNNDVSKIKLVFNSALAGVNLQISLKNLKSINAVPMADTTIALNTSAIGISVLTPSAGSVLAVGSTQAITWSSAGVSNVKIEYSTNAGSSWQLIIASATAGTGSYTWTVPNTVSDSCKVKISDAVNASVFSVSQGVFRIGAQCKDAVLSADWNIVSVPYLASDMRKTVLFPTANTPAYGFRNGYLVADTLKVGKGYWLRVPQAVNIPVCGTVPGTTIALDSGWNLMAGYANDITVSSIVTVPAGIISSSFYTYSNGYQNATVLTGGKGYWVRTSKSGVVNLSVSAKNNNQAIIKPLVNSNWKAVTVTDAAGRSRVLYLAANVSSAELLALELPPLPPDGLFDVRFRNQSVITGIHEPTELLIQGAEYPVTVSSEMTLSVMDKATGGSILRTVLPEGQQIQITNPAVQSLVVSTVQKPLSYSLEQNFPNPFNPATAIRYQIPEKGLVTLAVYDVAGRQVALLVNREQEAGAYTTEFNASGISSGVYFYQLRVNAFSEIKKLVVLK